MRSGSVIWGSVGILAATTFGAGIFSLPRIFQEAGWGTGLFYLAVIAALLIFIHRRYALVLEQERADRDLPDLVRRHLGKGVFVVGLAAVVGGLLLALVIYILLSAKFFGVLVPDASPVLAVGLFFIIASFLLRERLRWFARTELIGTLMMAAIIIVIFISAGRFGFGNGHAVVLENAALPFGAILLALAGWTGVEPAVAYARKAGATKKTIGNAFILGTGGVALLYVLFILGVLGPGVSVSMDTVSGLATSWSPIKLGILALFGLVAMAVSYAALGREVKKVLEQDLRFDPMLSFGTVLCVPPVLVALGFNNFTKVIGLVGGVFIAVEYALILLVTRKALKPKGPVRFVTDAAMLLFALAALYELYHFVVV